MRVYDSVNEIERECNECDSSEFLELYVDSYGGERDSDIEKTIFECSSCGKAGRLYEEGGNLQWSGVLR